MRVWIDADACPKAAKDLIVKFALKRKFEVVMVAGQAVAKPAFAIVRLIVVPSGMDAADDYLVEHAVPGELVICSDVPLADRLVKKGVTVLDPRGANSTSATWVTAWRRATCSPSCVSRARWGEGRRLMVNVKSRRSPMRWTGSLPGFPKPESSSGHRLFR